jgi:agmatinase
MADLRTMFGGSDTATFLGVAAASLDRLADLRPDVVVVGAPSATPYPSVGAYCRNAPAAIRRASSTYASTVGHRNFDLDGPVIPPGAVVVDLGDLIGDEADGPANREMITAAVSAILDAGAVPVVIGGDDSVPIPVLRALDGRAPFDVLQIDAHIDWRDDVGGERLGLSSTMRRTSELASVGAMVQVGRRGSGSAREADVEAAEARGVHFVSAHDAHRRSRADADWAVTVTSPMTAPAGFVTIDVDGLDPAIVPGVIGPEPGGLTYFQAIELIDAVAARQRIAGFDLVEFVPERDVNELGALTAFRLIAHAIGRILRQR